ncbi:fructuronate reductase [Erwinia sp. OLTSP20]|uniref:mannitol dehydrogenase family protein n=1 Tax=unclassified Erwinia TaxID=2622719 RepID=UPI000C189167|nr:MULTISPECIES: mannitol dehydrogenase family protein [unclassified Erwinia]PIJ50561.1 fructuronate reductase [Erwinia sp. OAMSP11]PIJ72879.1 fructuronate reductase [Erwinia sp. OLSSP12]PIJ82209.1 fructuronate reductase [Erwinia sp. OLCASP19]PIJ84762.1 fructuronate reductase [Erwinia sp. OLMTSP26]PIJ86727.1 fructuronate reductase [Erwinia sp. OLMDSP33]
MLTLSALKNSVITPDYDRNRLRTRMVHIGFGAFHRAHQALCADTLARNHGSDWGYCEINLHRGELIHALNAQHGLYSVAEMAGDCLSLRVVGVIKQGIHAAAAEITTALEALCQPEVAIVSITVTEKGYCHYPASGQLNPDHPDIIHDLANPHSPRSLPGILLAAIGLRRQRGLAPFSIMSCDNMPENGRVTRQVVCGLARLQDQALAEWISSKVAFPSTMVDRIVPAMNAESHQMVRQHLGCDDPVAVVCEPFFQWVIEDNFVSGRPCWEKAGAQLVADVLPYEEMKLRMLNGSHSFLAYLGYLAGYEHISDCMTDASLRQATRELMLAEQAPTLKIKGVDLTAYADALLARYQNHALRHRTEQIATDGTQKLPQRWLESIRWHLRQGSDFTLLALGVAGWMRYAGGINEQGEKIALRDPLAAELAQRVASTAQGPARVTALLGLQAVFAEDLPRNPLFVARVTDCYQQLLTLGARQTVQRLIQHRQR